jgi:isoquinoline 1-oxidoreductase beta subunit
MRASRRDFLKAGALGGTALLLRIPLLEAQGRASAAGAARFEPNKWLRIGSDGSVTLITARSEMGQGARTALAMILAEELEADWTKVAIEHAIPGERYPGMRTSGSSSVSDYWRPLRVAGAAAREMLLEAAAKTWGVPRSECRAENAAVLHAGSARRAGFGELVAIAATLPVPQDPALKAPKDFRLLGTRVARVDGPAIVTGRAVFGLDARPPGALVAAVARCPVPGGRAIDFDPAPAKAVRGVRDVVRLSTGIAVVADDTWSALKGRDALRVSWDEGENARDTTDTYWRRLEEAARRNARVTRTQGDFDKTFASAAKKVEAAYRFSFQAHAPVEPMNCVADVREGRCEIWVGTQAPNEAQKAAAKLLGIPLEAVTLHVTLLGGGFGRRLDYDYVPEAVELSKAIGKPVQIVWSRRDDMENDRFQPASINELAAGLDADGNVIAWSQQMTSFHLTMFGPYAPENVETDEENPWGAFDCPYEIPALRAVAATARSPVPTGAWRAVDYPPSIFARESFLDEVAHAAGRDPVRLRLDLLKAPDLLKVGSYAIQRGRLRAVIELAAEKAGWGKALPKIPGRRVGRGIAANVYHGRTHMAQVAEVSVGDAGDVRVHRIVCAADCGQIVNLAGVEGQIEGGIIWGLSAALKTEITFRDGRIEQHTFKDFPVLGIHETPAIEVHMIASEESPSGIGEQPVPPAAPAVANAIFAATGRRVRKLPIRPRDVLNPIA